MYANVQYYHFSEVVVNLSGMLDIDWSLFLLFPVFLLSRSIDLIDELITWDSLNLFRGKEY